MLEYYTQRITHLSAEKEHYTELMKLHRTMDDYNNLHHLHTITHIKLDQARLCHLDWLFSKNKEIDHKAYLDETIKELNKKGEDILNKFKSKRKGHYKTENVNKVMTGLNIRLEEVYASLLAYFKIKYDELQQK